MEKVYVLVILLSLFAHSWGIFYCPQGPSADSAVFIILAPIAFHKLKVKKGLWEPRTWLGKIVELGILCLLMQVFLVGLWFPVHQVLQNLVDYLCVKHNTAPRSRFIEVCQKKAATVLVLAIEVAVLLTFFLIEDVHGIYGSKDELVTQSTLLILEKRQKTLERRERMRQRNQN